MEDFVYYGNLFAIYKDLLNEVNKEYYSLYYEENLTLQEIADNKKVSKSYVGNIIKKTTESLLNFENILHLYQKRELLNEALDSKNIEDVKEIIKEVIE